MPTTQKVEGSEISPQAELLESIQLLAVNIAWKAGEMLTAKFGGGQLVEFKNNDKTDPVTVLDRECQMMIQQSVADKFPTHGFLGEETTPTDHATAPDFVWVVDPLDGTKNFINGLPIFACSIGVLHLGEPVAAATFIPWPGGNGRVVHARKGNGTYVGDRPASVFKGEKPEHFKLCALPGSFNTAFNTGAALGHTTGEARNTGSMAFDLAMTAVGAVQYTVMTAPKVWDVASGALLVKEAGGLFLVGTRVSRLQYSVTGKLTWTPLTGFLPNWKSGKTKMADLWAWSHNVVAGGPGVASFVASNLRRKPPVSARLSKMFKKPPVRTN